MFVGIDIEEVSRFVIVGENIKAQIFTKSEIAYCESKTIPSQHYAGFFCAKEAIIKALSQKGEEIPSMNQIEILHDKRRPYAKLPLKLSLSISISHTKNYATAICIISNTSG